MLAPLLPLLWLAAARGFGNMHDGTGRAELCDVRQGGTLQLVQFNLNHKFKHRSYRC